MQAAFGVSSGNRKWAILGYNKFEMVITHSIIVQRKETNYRIDQQAKIIHFTTFYW